MAYGDPGCLNSQPKFATLKETPRQFDNFTDEPRETKNLAAEKPEIIARLKAELAHIHQASRTRP